MSFARFAFQACSLNQKAWVLAVANLWPTSVRDYTETRINTRVFARDLFPQPARVTSFPMNEVRPRPPLVRHAEVGSSSLLPSTSLRSRKGAPFELQLASPHR